MQEQPTALQSATVPESVKQFARTTRNPEACVQCWVLRHRGGLIVREVAQRVGVSYATATRWLGAMPGADAPDPVTGSVSLSLDDVAARRAQLLAEAEDLPLEAKLRVQAGLLADEQRRLGGDISKVEQQTLTVSLQLMPPEQRQEELRMRLERMAQAGTLPAPLAALTHTPAHEGAPSPPGGAPTPIQSPADVSPKNSEIEAADAALEDEGDD